MNKGFEHPNWSAARAFVEYHRNKLLKVTHLRASGNSLGRGLSQCTFTSPSLQQPETVEASLGSGATPAAAQSTAIRQRGSFSAGIAKRGRVQERGLGGHAITSSRLLRVVLVTRTGSQRRSILNQDEVTCGIQV